MKTNKLPSVRFGRHLIEFELTFSKRKTLAISVHPDGRVTVAAPLGSSPDEVCERVRQRCAWVVRQKQEFARFRPPTPPRRYVSGETHLYLGGQYRLKVEEAAEEGVKLARGWLHVSTSDRTNNERVRALLERWYRRRAEEVFSRRLEACRMAPPLRGVEVSGFRLRAMPTRWGSCTSAGAVLLNPWLVRAPLACVDYVITHELCHVKVMSHGPEFYRLLSRCLPDWRRRKERLDGREW